MGCMGEHGGRVAGWCLASGRPGARGPLAQQHGTGAARWHSPSIGLARPQAVGPAAAALASPPNNCSWVVNRPCPPAQSCEDSPHGTLVGCKKQVVVVVAGQLVDVGVVGSAPQPAAPLPPLPRKQPMPGTPARKPKPYAFSSRTTWFFWASCLQVVPRRHIRVCVVWVWRLLAPEGCNERFAPFLIGEVAIQ